MRRQAKTDGPNAQGPIPLRNIAHGPIPDGPAPGMRAWVAFCGKAELRWLRVLRPGFRHCFLILHDGRHWLTLDPLSHRLDLAVQPLPASVDVPALYRRAGYRVVPARLRTPLRAAPPGVLSCVEIVKRALGLNGFLILTPYQLYCRLVRDHRRPADAGGA